MKPDDTSHCMRYCNGRLAARLLAVLSMRLTTSISALLITAPVAGLLACSSSPVVKVTADSGNVAHDELIGTFTVSLVSAQVEGGINPPYTDAAGEVDDGPYPELAIETQLTPPADATPGCAVYSLVTPNCDGIGKCGSASTNTACADAAKTGINACVCVATDTCQAYPTSKNVGTVTVSGVETTSGATTFQLTNVNNSYIVDTSTTTLVYPGFKEGDTLSVSASGADYAAFEIANHGVQPLILTHDDFTLLKDTSSSDPSQYQALTIAWNPPDSTAAAGITIELNISRHAGTVGYMLCHVEDTGSLTISASLISQLVTLGNIAGFPELNVTRSIVTSTFIEAGRIDFVVESNVERYPTIEGFTSCLLDANCPTGQVCNTAKKLCQTPQN